MNDSELKQKVKESAEAEKIVKSAVYQKATTMIKAELFRQFEGTKFKDSELRDEVWRKMQAINWVDQAIMRIIKEGSIAEKKLLDKIREKLS